MITRGLTVEIKNSPLIIEPGFLVVRRDDHNASLWYYGFYQDKKRAQEIAVEIGNGIVLEVEE